MAEEASLRLSDLQLAELQHLRWPVVLVVLALALRPPLRLYERDLLVLDALDLLAVQDFRHSHQLA